MKGNQFSRKTERNFHYTKSNRQASCRNLSIFVVVAAVGLEFAEISVKYSRLFTKIPVCKGFQHSALTSIHVLQHQKSNSKGKKQGKKGNKNSRTDARNQTIPPKNATEPCALVVFFLKVHFQKKFPSTLPYFAFPEASQSVS